MKRTGTLVLAAALGFGSIYGLAGADRNTKTDPAGDSALGPGLDIVKAKAKHKGKRKLVHTVTMDAALPPNLDDFQVSLLLNRDGDRDCEREFHATSDLGKIPMVRCGIGEGQKSGRLAMPNDRTLKFTFSRKSIIGKKDKYGWRFRTRENPGDPDADSLPNDGPGGLLKYVKHKLD